MQIPNHSTVIDAQAEFSHLAVVLGQTKTLGWECWCRTLLRSPSLFPQVEHKHKHKHYDIDIDTDAVLKNNTTNNYTSEKLTTKQGKGLAQWERLVKRREVPEASRCGGGRFSKAIKRAPAGDYDVPEDYLPEDQGVPEDYNVLDDLDYEIPDDSDIPEDHGVPEEDVLDLSKRGRRLEDIEPCSQR